MFNLYFHHLPTFEAEKFIIRPLQLSDTEAFYKLRTDEKVNRYIRRNPFQSHTEAEVRLNELMKGIQEEKWYYWAIQLSDKPELIGTILLWNLSKERSEAELGYELHPLFHRKGIMNEAVSIICHFAFNTVGFQKIIAVIQPQNIASIHLIEKQGFTQSHQLLENGDIVYSKIKH